MMRKIVLIGLCALLSSCGGISKEIAHFSGYSLICVEETHVQYVQFASGAALLVDLDGRPVRCD